MSDVKFTVTIPCKTYDEAVKACEEVWGDEMLWKNGKAYPVDDENPCVIARLSTIKKG